MISKVLNALDIHVTGIVQGVGFRPFVYRQAKRHLVNGWVLNAVDGVHIHAEGEEQLVDEFVMAIHDEAPAAAHVARIDMTEVPLEGFSTFEIRFSDADDVEETTLVSPDLATCDDCLQELFDVSNRRYRYPFINCTNCGPRFTIIDGLPYDRVKTSMRSFEMCEACAAEYTDPADRRFHAQPDACFTCGPSLNFVILEGQSSGSATCRFAVQNPAQQDSSCAPLLHASKEIASQSSRNGVQTVASPPLCPSVADSSTTYSNEGVSKPSGEAPKTPSCQQAREESDSIIARAVELLAAGKIVAVKGLGGFHLVCDAANAETLAELRRRKKREGKAFAVMVPHVEAARLWCSVSAEEEKLLQSPARPIVLLRKQAGIELAAGLADKLPELGIMLPATPLQHLILHDFEAAMGRNMLVFTSGNIHDEPIQIDDEEACVALAGIADALVGNNRAIRARYDDSVVRVLDFGGETAIQFIRRARGYAPLPISLQVDRGVAGVPSEGFETPFLKDCEAISIKSSEEPERTRAQARAAQAPSDGTPEPPLLATGPEQKNTFCFLDGQRAFVSQHMGDMENVQTFDAWLEAKATYEKLFELAPAHIACDMHPEYLTSKWAAEQNLPLTQVQHHHAHIVSAMAEHGLEGPVLGFAFDGTGYGPDGAIWGGEVLLANLATYECFANFAYVPLPGGAAAIKHPLRCAYGALWAFDLLEHPATARVLEALGDEAQLCEQMIEQDINTPYTSSVGRLFDAASAILGICSAPTYEGEAAILLEAIMGVGGAPLERFETPFLQDCEAISFQSSEEPERMSPEGEQRRPLSNGVSPAPYTIDLVKNTATDQSTALDTSVVLLDAAPAFKALLDDLQAGVPIPEIARRFHDAFVDAIVQMAQVGQAVFGISTIALSGGVFMNRYLCEHAVPALAEAGFAVALNKDLPPNDGCISFGQACITSAVLANSAATRLSAQ